MSDDELASDDSQPPSLTSTTVANLVAHAKSHSPILSFTSPSPSLPAPVSALSSSLVHHTQRLMKHAYSEYKDPRQSPPASNADPNYVKYTITPYEPGTPNQPLGMRRSSHSSSSSPLHPTNSASPLPSPSPSPSPRTGSPLAPSPVPSPGLPSASLPRPIPTAATELPDASPLHPALSSSAPVVSVHLMVESDDEDEFEQRDRIPYPNPPLSSNRRSSGSHLLPSSRSREFHSPHHLLTSSKDSSSSPLSTPSTATTGISSISSLMNPAHPNNTFHDAFKRSRRLSQSSIGDSPRRQSPRAADPDHMVFVTNAAEAGYPGYAEMASHESLDYHTIHNELLRAELGNLTDLDYVADNVQRWCVTAMIGALIGCIGFASHYVIDTVSAFKFDLVARFLRSDWLIAYGIYAGFNLVLVTFGALLIVYFCPAAGGSGIPEVKGFLNGTAISRAMNVKTFITKFVASTAAVSSSLPVGPEGPMIHMGAMVGGGFSQPRSKTLNVQMPWFQKFHTDRDRRDFIAMGAACGVASAFGAPLGGVLFAIEEASSFWSQMLTWRTFFACMTATFFTNFLLSGVQGGWGVYDFSQSIEFDVLAANAYDSYAIWELLPFGLMGCVSGLTGALFNWFSERMVLVRGKHVTHHPRRRVLEMVFLSIVVSSLMFFSPMYFPCQKCPSSSDPNPNIDCSVGDTSSMKKAVQFLCPDKQYNALATLMFTTNTGTVRHLFSRGSSNEFDMLTLFFFFVCFFVLAMYASGGAVAGGLLVPLLIIGAAYGRLFGAVMQRVGFSSVDPGVYALIGAASFFSGVSRMTISLCIIMLEITNDLHYLPAIMLTVMMAKWVGDFFTPPVYEGLMELKFYPFLDQDPPIEMDLLVSSDIMAARVKLVTETPRVKDLIELLKSCEHNGFPVVSHHPMHRPITTEPANQRKSLGVPVGMPSQSHVAERLAAAQSKGEVGPANSRDVASPSFARPAVAKQAAATTTTPKPASTANSSPRLSFTHGSPANQPSHPSPPGGAKQPITTAGVADCLGHGSGRVLRGLILRKQLLILLQAQAWHTSRRLFNPLDMRQRLASLDMKHQPQLIAEIERDLTIADANAKLDLRPYMNRSPFSVHYDFHSVFCFRLFRSMGLRHLPVVNDANEVVGIITRKDIVSPIVKMKYDALLGCKEDGYIDFPGVDLLLSSDTDEDEHAQSNEPALLSPTSERRANNILRVKKRRLRPALKAYSYLSPLESSPEMPGTPVYSTPTLLSRPLLGMSPKDSGHGHKNSFNWSSRLTSRV